MKKIVLYGLGKNGKRLYDNLEKDGLSEFIYCFCDYNAGGIKEYKGVKVYTYEDIKEEKDLFYIVTPDKKEEIEAVLAQDGQHYLKRTWQQKIIDKVPIGHYYSPIPNIKQLKNEEDRIFREISVEEMEKSGINLNMPKQIELMKKLSEYINDTFPMRFNSGYRYYLNNEAINETDSMTLHAMLCCMKPKKVIEIGSGYSSAMMLDTNEKWMDINDKIHFTFIEPYTERLKSLLKQEDYVNADILEKRVQDINLELFETLEDNDILFIDSSHVSKAGSDVNFELFEILPRLKSGVIIHFHDICWGFIYPKKWLFESMYHWNEAYLLRAFLTNNKDYEILFWADSIPHFSDEWKEFYNTKENCSGGSIWIRKLR